MNTVAVQAQDKLRLYIAIAAGDRGADSLKEWWRKAARRFGVSPERVRNIWRGRTMPKFDEGEAMRLIALSLAQQQAQQLSELQSSLRILEQEHEQLNSGARYLRGGGTDQGTRDDSERDAAPGGPGSADRETAEGNSATRASAIRVE